MAEPEADRGEADESGEAFGGLVAAGGLRLVDAALGAVARAVEGAADGQGQTVRADGRNGVKVNGATVSQADILASNGVIHRIDRVLLPK